MSFDSTQVDKPCHLYPSLKAGPAVQGADPDAPDSVDSLAWNEQSQYGLVYNPSQSYHGHPGSFTGGIDNLMTTLSPHWLDQSFYPNGPHVVSSADSAIATESSTLPLDENLFSDCSTRPTASPDAYLFYSSSSEGSYRDAVAQSVELVHDTHRTLDTSHSLQSQPWVGSNLSGTSMYSHNHASVVPSQLGGQRQLPSSYPTYTASSPSPSPSDRDSPFSSDVGYSPALNFQSRQRGRLNRQMRSMSATPRLKSSRRSATSTPRHSRTPVRDIDIPCTKQTHPFALGQAFPCLLAPYGCKASFGSKNEWKRHMRRQHLRFDLWRCDLCGNREGHDNDFHRKDLFQQHLRRMHCRSASESVMSRASSMEPFPASDLDMSAIVQRCHVRVRGPPQQSACHFCPAEFKGHGSWEMRVEHIGQHLEYLKKQGYSPPAVVDWLIDAGFHGWLHDAGIIVTKNGHWRLADGPRHARHRSVDASVTARSAARCESVGVMHKIQA